MQLLFSDLTLILTIAQQFDVMADKTRLSLSYI